MIENKKYSKVNNLEDVKGLDPKKGTEIIGLAGIGEAGAFNYARVFRNSGNVLAWIYRDNHGFAVRQSIVYNLLKFDGRGNILIPQTSVCLPGKDEFHYNLLEEAGL